MPILRVRLYEALELTAKHSAYGYIDGFGKCAQIYWHRAFRRNILFIPTFTTLILMFLLRIWPTLKLCVTLFLCMWSKDDYWNIERKALNWTLICTEKMLSLGVNGISYLEYKWIQFLCISMNKQTNAQVLLGC